MGSTRTLSPAIPMLLCLACTSDIEEYAIDQAAIGRFEAEAKAVALSDEHDSPLAGLISPTNSVGAPLGVQIWNPEATLRGVGIENGDVISGFDEEDLYGPLQEAWKLTGKPFREGQFNQGPFHPESEKYVWFVRRLLERRHTTDSILLEIHGRYFTIKEREKYGLYKDEPRLIRINFD